MAERNFYEWLRGYDAYIEGKDSSSNPYLEEDGRCTEESLAWQGGWCEAREDEGHREYCKQLED